MGRRTFGWIQNPASIDNLRNTVGIFVKGSESHHRLVKEKIPFLVEHDLALDPDQMLEWARELDKEDIELSYDELKGKGAGSDGRKNAKCSGLVQAAITAQKTITVTDSTGVGVSIKKPYTDDWTADGFLRWAISIGLLDYDSQKDSCRISESEIGRAHV